VGGGGQQVLALKDDLARDASRAATCQAERGERGNGLSRSRLPHDPERPARVDLIGDAVDGMDDAVLGLKADPQVMDFEQGAHVYLTRGSRYAYAISTIRFAT